jgi:hypothetical protein
LAGVGSKIAYSISTARPAFRCSLIEIPVAVGAPQLASPECSGLAILFIVLPVLALKDPFIVVVLGASVRDRRSWSKDSSSPSR